MKSSVRSQLPSRNSNQHTTSNDYAYGFHSPIDAYAFVSQPGLSVELVETISKIKKEPVWMKEKRLHALSLFKAISMPTWGGDLSQIDFDTIHYYLRPTTGEQKTWNDVPDSIKETFEKLGTPQAEREYLAGIKNQFDSEVVQGKLKQVWEEKGVVFVSMDEAVQRYPELVKQYFGTIIPSGDNKFAALNTAVWSGGSFIYVPKNVEVTLPLQAYFRINAERAGQFERTLIIADEGSKIHYVEGCFVKGTRVYTKEGIKQIQEIKKNDSVLTHTNTFHNVKKTQKRSYSGELYEVDVYGNLSEKIECTPEHPFLAVKRMKKNERNSEWKAVWTEAQSLQAGDYVLMPIDQCIESEKEYAFPIVRRSGKKMIKELFEVQLSEDFFRLVGYYLAEGSISSGHYLSFSFNEKESEYILDVQQLISSVFSEYHISLTHHAKNHGTSVVVSATALCRVFEHFGKGAQHKSLPEWILHESLERQKQIVIGWFRGDGSYSKKRYETSQALKEAFRIATVSKKLAYQMRMILARLGVVASIDVRDRKKENRQTMYMIIISGENAVRFGEIVGIPIEETQHSKKRPTYFHIDEKYIYCPIRSIQKKFVKNIDVYNMSVTRDESYTANGYAVHNCTSPSFSSQSLHSAVVEVIIKPKAQVQYTTIQNWYKHVYNLVTKRARVEQDAKMIWTDFNIGSKLTMKYPSFVLAGERAHGETLSMAFAGNEQVQDTGSKAIHLASNTTSLIVNKSICKDGGVTSYRGLVSVSPTAKHCKNHVICDALILDDKSVSNTYPTQRVLSHDATITHEATVSKIGEQQLQYIMSRGISESQARAMIVRGFAEELIQKLPMEYAVELNRFIDMEMEGSVG